MKSKRKHIIGTAIASMLFALPLVSAADDDVVIFGEQYEETVEPVQVPNDTPSSSEDNSENSEQKSDTLENIPETNDESNSETTSYDTNEIKSEVKTEKEIDNPSADENNSNGSNDISESNNPVTVPSVPDGTADVNNPVKEVQDNVVKQELDSNNHKYDIGENINFHTDDNNKGDNTNKNVPESTQSINTDKNNNVTNENLPKNQNNNYSNKNNNATKKQKARFVKITGDDTYEYYLDRNAVRWINMPYSTSEYMADAWIRMIEKKPNNDDMPADLYNYVNESFDDEIADAAAKGISYDEVDIKVLRTKKYFLEHYYIRPKTQQIQFLCELEVVGRPQNAISERAYDYRNWENLIPGSIEYSIYHGVLANISKSKANKRGHMTFADMVEEYGRISIR